MKIEMELSQVEEAHAIQAVRDYWMNVGFQRGVAAATHEARKIAAGYESSDKTASKPIADGIRYAASIIADLKP